MFEIMGVGTDLCAISRIEKALDRPNFAERFFTPEERTYFESRGKGRAQSAAAMFAAKEAVAKALGTGFSGGIMPGQIGVLHDAMGKPEIRLSGAALQRMEALGGRRIHLSLAHEGDMALAFAVLEAF